MITDNDNCCTFTAGDIITTRSWRVGAKLVLQELGPNKLPKMGESPPCKDKSEERKILLLE